MKRTKRAALAVPGAVLLSIMVASQALAYAWPISAQLSTAAYPHGGVATDGATHSVAVFVEWNGNGYDVKARHSGGSGWSWGAPITLSTNGFEPAVSGFGQYFDVVWQQGSRVRYARSTNNGVSFGASVALTPARAPLPTRLSVARGADGQVVVAWQNANNSNVRVRVSTDGGVTFGAVKTLAAGAVGRYLGTSAAVGDGVVYVAYSPTGAKLFVARSTDGGASWTTTEISNAPWRHFETAHAQFSLTAEGTEAYIAYAVRKANPAKPSVKYRRSTNSGASWSSQMNLAPKKWKTWEPDVSLQNGTLRAVFTRKAATPSVYYRESTDGLAWSTRQQVALGDGPGVGYAGDIVVVYRYIDPNYGIYARAGS